MTAPTAHFSQAQMDGRACIWCDRGNRRMVPTGHLGQHTLMRCYPTCEESLPDPRPAPDVDVMSSYLAKGWDIDEAGSWHEPEGGDAPHT
jgi:hypothetical protein